MALTLRKAAVAAVLACAGSMAHALVLDFEDLPGLLGFFTADYQGLTFGTNDAFTNAWFYTRRGDADYQAHSGRYFISTDYRLYTPGALWEEAQPIKSAVDIYFDGAWFGGSDQIRYKLFNDGKLVYTSPDSPALAGLPQFIPSGYDGLIDEIVIVGRQGWFAMDDLTYRQAAVPEPSVYLMFAVGVAGVAWRLRKRAA